MKTIGRCWRAPLLLALPVMLGATSITARSQEVAESPSEGDSARNLREAKSALRTYWVRLDFPSDPRSGFEPAGFNVWLHKKPFGRKFAPAPLRPGSLATTEDALVENLPEALCELQIGPYCYGPRNGRLVYDGPTSMPVALRTADRSVMSVMRGIVRRLYRDFISRLDRLQTRAPGDRWIVGQRVLHRVERGELQEAAQVADRCRSDPRWCAALVGYTKMLLGLTRSADSAFTRALATMPDSVRCRWEDLTPLFDGDASADWYRDLDCAGRRTANRTIWWLADPLFIEAGNERERAHHFRMTLARLSADGEDRLPRAVRPWNNQYRFPHGPSYHAALVRVGEPHYMALGERMSERHPPTFVLQYLYPAYQFIATAGAAREPLRARATDWSPLDSFPREQLRAGFGAFTSLDYQVAFFRRGDSARVVAAADVAGEPLLAGGSLLGSALVLARSPDVPPRIVRQPLPGTHTFVTTVAAESVLVSLEAIAAGVGAGRARLAAGPPSMPPQRLSLSDVLILDSATALPSDLESAASRAAPRARVAVGATIGLYWEVYDLAASDTMTLSLSVVEHAPSRMARFGQILGIVAGSDSTRVRWTESRAESGPIVGQSIALDLRTLDRGDYTLRLEVAVPGQLPVAVTRELRIRDGG